MQSLATRVFIGSAVVFGIIGVIFFIGLAAGWDGTNGMWLFAAWGISGSVVLSSFALSVAGKYLSDTPSQHT